METNQASRTHNTIRNTTVSMTLLVLSYVSNFLYRMFFLRYLSDAYLGISTTLASIVAILSLTELGFGTAICYFLYKPLGIDKDEQKVISIMNFIRKVYLVMASATLVLGIAIFPFLDKIIDPLEVNPNIKIVYWFLVAGNIASYIGAHKSVILTADQKEFVNKTAYYSSKILSQVLIIILLSVYKNYWVVLIIDLCFALVQNVFLVIYVNKKYPFLKNKAPKIEKTEIKEMIKTTGSMFVNKAGTVVLNSTDSLIISAFIGTIISGLYSNYLMIINAINTTIYIVFASVNASVGNYVLKEEKEDSYKLLRAVNLIGAGLAIVASLGVLFAGDSFVNLWLGESYIFDTKIVVLIAISLFLENYARANEIYLLPMGLVKKTVWWGIVYVLVNLGSSIIFVEYFGLAGVLYGTILARIIVVVADSIILYKSGFNKNPLLYYVDTAWYFVIWLVCGIVIYFSTRFTIEIKILDLLAKVAIIVVEGVTIFFIFTFKLPQFKRCLVLLPFKLRNKISILLKL